MPLFRRSVEYGFEMIAVGVGHECRVVGAAVFRAKARSPGIAAAGDLGFGMKAVHALAIMGRESNLRAVVRAGIVELQTEILTALDAVGEHGHVLPNERQS